jgi:AbrB family looped-hinge helix DNA binding protein
MVTTMDPSGRLVIPSDIRRESGIEPGVPLSIRWREGVIEIEPQSLPIRLARKGRLLVALPVHPVKPLDDTTVERTRAGLRQRAGRG